LLLIYVFLFHMLCVGMYCLFLWLVRLRSSCHLN